MSSSRAPSSYSTDFIVDDTKKRPERSSRVPCNALSAARFNAASAFSKSRPRLMSSISASDPDQRHDTRDHVRELPRISLRSFGLRLLMSNQQRPNVRHNSEEI